MSFSIIKKIYSNLWILRSLPKTVYFNFHYLPFKQAVKLPILLYKPHFQELKGCIKIESENIRRGMICLGVYDVNIYPNTGIMLDIRGNITFKGSCRIGNASYFTSNGGSIVFGDNFHATTSLRLINYDYIEFGDNVLVGWDCMICDNDFHTLSDVATGYDMSVKGPICIGNKVWVANGCSIMKNSSIPSNTIVSSKSLVNKNMEIPEYSLIAGTPAKLKKQNVRWKI